MTTQHAPALATEALATGTHLIVVTDTGEHPIAWEQCSPRLARASAVERACLHLLPSGYGIHWPLLDEDLAVGPLLSAARDSNG